MASTAPLVLSRLNSGLQTASCCISELKTAEPSPSSGLPSLVDRARPGSAAEPSSGSGNEFLAWRRDASAGDALVEFDSWEQFRRSYDLLPPRSSGVYQINSPVSQFLMRTGVTLFKEMRFEDLRRLQLDIETLSLNPQ